MGEVNKLKSIYLGKGRDLQEHPGNIYFRSFVEAFTEQYEAANKASKRHVITGVMKLLEMDGYRFYKVAREEENEKMDDVSSDDESWIPAGMEEIYSKVGHVFRSCRKGRFKFKKGGRADDATTRAMEHLEAIKKAFEARSKILDQEKNNAKDGYREQHTDRVNSSFGTMRMMDQVNSWQIRVGDPFMGQGQVGNGVTSSYPMQALQLPFAAATTGMRDAMQPRPWGAHFQEGLGNNTIETEQSKQMPNVFKEGNRKK
jgi:hypothetical protein